MDMKKYTHANVYSEKYDTQEEEQAKQLKRQQRLIARKFTATIIKRIMRAFLIKICIGLLIVTVIFLLFELGIMQPR